MTGVGIGAGAGAVIGSKSNKSNSSKGRAIGALTGALFSGIVGYFVHKRIEKRDAKIRRQTLFNLDKHDVSRPQGFGFSSAHGVTAPKIESEWVPTRVEGKKLIEGHKVWLITDDIKWVPNSGRQNKNK